MLAALRPCLKAQVQLCSQFMASSFHSSLCFTFLALLTLKALQRWHLYDLLIAYGLTSNVFFF